MIHEFSEDEDVEELSDEIVFLTSLSHQAHLDSRSGRLIQYDLSERMYFCNKESILTAIKKIQR